MEIIFFSDKVPINELGVVLIATNSMFSAHSLRHHTVLKIAKCMV